MQNQIWANVDNNKRDIFNKAIVKYPYCIKPKPMWAIALVGGIFYWFSYAFLCTRQYCILVFNKQIGNICIDEKIDLFPYLNATAL